MNNVKKNYKIVTARHPLPVGLKYSRDPTTKGASPRSIIKSFLLHVLYFKSEIAWAFLTLPLSQHWTLLEHAWLAWLTSGFFSRAWLILRKQGQKLVSSDALAVEVLHSRQFHSFCHLLTDI